MSLDIERLQKMLCSLMCADIRLISRRDYIMVKTPFLFPDGDPYILYLQERPAGLLRLTDAGHTMMHLSYENDVDKFHQGTRRELFDQILATNGFAECEGEIFIDIKLDEIVSSLFLFGQTITSISDLTFLNRSRVESTFYEDLFEILKDMVALEKIKKNYTYPGMDNPSDYPIDYRIRGKVDPLFVFGIPNRDKAKLTTIILERLLRVNAVFESILIFANQSSIPRTDIARLSNVGGEMVASLDDDENLRRKISRRAA